MAKGTVIFANAYGFMSAKASKWQIKHEHESLCHHSFQFIENLILAVFFGTVGYLIANA